MKKKLFSVLCGLAMGLTAFGQQAIFGQRNQIVSPQINQDGTVTFRLSAPRAQKVEIQGDFIQRRAEMKQENGVWTYTTGDLAPELYSYKFVVDGIELLDPSNLERSRDVKSFMSTFVISKQEGDAGYLYAPHDVPHGNVSQVWYDSPTLGINRRMTIYTPAGYETSGKKYPIMYLLHGAGGDEEAWITLGRTAQIMDNLIALGKAEPMIVVMPNGNAGQKASPSFQVGPEGRAKASYQESFPDIMNYMQKNYRLKGGAANTAICGLSMGGGHSFSISMMNPGTFGYIGLYSAAVSMGGRGGQAINADLPDDAPAAKQLKALFAAKPKLYWIGIGKTDFLYDQNKNLRSYLDKKAYPYEYFENEDGHIWKNWRIYLSIFAQKLFK